MTIAYDILYSSAALLTSPAWIYRLARTGKWRTDWSGRFGRVPAMSSPSNDQPTLLIHAVSVGEVVAIAPLVKRIGQMTNHTWRIVISVTTDTGYKRACNLFEPQHRVVRYPFDLTVPVRRFLDYIKPDLIALTELELWPNFLAECTQRRIPICVVSGRLSDRSFKRYRMVRPLVHRTFAQLTAAAVQTPEYAARFAALGTPQERIHVLDSMKWDTTTPGSSSLSDNSTTSADLLAKAMGIDRSRPLIVAGSTGPGEEQLLIETCPDNAQLLLVPRRPERFDEVAALVPEMIRRSEHPDHSGTPTKPGRIFLLDTIGELSTAYALADIAIVGRSFLGLYGSNPLESIAQAKPTIIGPHYDDFADIVDALRQQHGILVTTDPGPAAADLLQHPDQARELSKNAQDVLQARRGATDRHVNLLQDLMSKTTALRTPTDPVSTPATTRA